MSKRTANQGSLKHGRITRYLFVSKQLHVTIGADGKAHAIVPRGTGTTYTKVKHGELT